MRWWPTPSRLPSSPTPATKSSRHDEIIEEAIPVVDAVEGPVEIEEDV